MTRDRWIEKLKTIISRVEAGEAPARIREIHVFGSFARGAIEPNDLDLIVIHDRPSREVLAPLLQAVKSYSYDDLDRSFKAYLRFEAAMRKVFRRGGDRMDIVLAESFDLGVAGLVDIPRGEIRLVWSESDRDWKSHVAAIAPNSTAGRHPRHHFINVKRAGCTLDAVDKVTEMIDSGVLSLEKLRLDDINAQLNREFQHWFDHWTQIRCMGVDALKVLPWGMWWLQEQGAARPRIDRPTALVDEGWRFRVELGRLYPYHVFSLFESSRTVIRQCLIPYRKVREENWMYVFERGPNWEKTKQSY
jgi:predicted nucleotidyltransferase